MKKMVVVLMAMGLLGVMPVFAAEHGDKKMESKECVIRCSNQAETIQEKIERIKKEIDQGSQKYSAEDLKKLEDRLKETNKLLDDMNKP